MSHSILNVRDNILMTAWKVCKYYNLPQFVKELILNDCSMPILRLQYPAFLNPRDRLLKCVSLDSTDFQMSLSIIG
jgi:hypothetical protein